MALGIGPMVPNTLMEPDAGERMTTTATKTKRKTNNKNKGQAKIRDRGNNKGPTHRRSEPAAILGKCGSTQALWPSLDEEIEHLHGPVSSLPRTMSALGFGAAADHKKRRRTEEVLIESPTDTRTMSPISAPVETGGVADIPWSDNVQPTAAVGDGFASLATRRDRNRQAANRCRAKTRTAIAKLEGNAHMLESRHECLIEEATQLRDEVFALKQQLLVDHGSCDCHLIREYFARATVLIGNTYRAGGRSE